MHRETSANPSALRPSQATAAELVSGGKNIAIPAEQPLGELTQAPVREYALPADLEEIDREEAALLSWAQSNHRLFPSHGISTFESQAGPKGGGSEHDAWVLQAPQGKVVIRRTIHHPRCRMISRKGTQGSRRKSSRGDWDLLQFRRDRFIEA